MRLIDEDDVLRSMKQFRDIREKDMEMTGSRGTGCSWDDAVTIIKRTPTVDAVERKKGKWIPVTNGRGGYCCELCNRYAPSYRSGEEHLSRFCPNCGAEME